MMFRWDGGFIMVSWDGFDEGVEWYTHHFGWTCLDKVITPVGKKAFLQMPKAGVVTLKSFEGDYEHFLNDHGEEGNVRLCFEIGDLERMIDYARLNKIPFSTPITLPNGMKSIDIIGFENARFTVFENPSLKDTYPEAKILGFGEVNTRIGVTNLDHAVEWYTKNLGFIKKEVNHEMGFAHLQTEDAYDRHVLKETFYDNIYLEKIETAVKGNPSVRTYFDIRPDEFFDAYNMLIKNGVTPSQIAGDPMKGWGGFHIFDPDGNRINIWSYQMMREVYKG
ncbi:VOC family protein [Ferdinandcohnia quinoae]|uniref:VOC family protein n=1 Tax=Fredinandcohnia quinoae TaxID=2918902 RepID=A0AAW5EAM8_9BACI|nr:VOC family protein [Fredinandcohnia sp. SECRCQ15]MCH1625809.1 VOC family protein [Fredinandcohnia sp. SECRCQ15]